MSTVDDTSAKQRAGRPPDRPEAPDRPGQADDSARTVEIPVLDGEAALAQDEEPGAAWLRTQASPEFQALRHGLRRFAFPATVAFLAWYLLYLLMSDYARGFMDTRVLGNINVAYVFGLLQFVSTFVIAYLYSRYAQRHLDPAAAALRRRLESGR